MVLDAWAEDVALEAKRLQAGRLQAARLPAVSDLRSMRLPWFAEQVQSGYFVAESLSVTVAEREAYAAFAQRCYAAFAKTCGELLAGPFDASFGLSPKFWALAAHAWQNREQQAHVFGRFDLAGILDGAPGALIEFNADTATVLAEAALIQELQLKQGEVWSDIVEQMAKQLAGIAAQRPDDNAVLILTLAYGEDVDTAQVWRLAAERAGLHADQAYLPAVTFSPGEGVFMQVNADDWLRYGIVVKLFPWDWIDAEEPDLLDDLDALIRGGEVVVVNPPYSALMQSKAMLVELHRCFPEEAGFLAAGFGAGPIEHRQVRKPLFGREGESVSVHAAHTGAVEAAAPGDYAEQASIWQAFTELPIDSQDRLYQAGVYWAGSPCGLAFRRQASLIIDERAEFVAARVGDV